jgi:modification methylase
MIIPGSFICDSQGAVKALVRADGTLALGQSVGSIHRIGALAQGLDACNGWFFWHCDTPGGLVSIDVFRAQIRAELVPRFRSS